MTTSLSLAFLSFPEEDEERIIDLYAARLLRKIVGKFDHVEIVFADGQACSVLSGSRVFFQPKGFSRNGYEYLTISGLEPEQVRQIRLFCQEQVLNGEKFSEVGLCRAGTPFPRRKGRNGYFCSQLVTTALQQGGLLKGSVPGCMTPYSVYQAVQHTIPSHNIHKGVNPCTIKRLKNRFNNDIVNHLLGTQASTQETVEAKPWYEKMLGASK